MPYYSRDNYRLYYYIDGKGQPVVFLHGYLGSSKSHWGKQLENPDLSSQFQLIAPDLRGYAKSSLGKRVEKNKTEDHILDIRMLLIDELKLNKNPIFVGYSVGGTLALMYAIKYPGSTQAIVLVSPRPFLHETTRAWNFLAKEKRTGKKKSAFASFLWSIVKRFQKLLSYIYTKRRLRKSQNYLQQLEELEFPILMLYGNKDTVNPSIAFEVLKKHLPQAQIIEFDGDHGITHEHYEEFNKILLEFLNESKIT
ncbi:MAG: alpha/beta fold hydrolase [Candidatus Hodarchaeota archaeon]